MTYISSYSTLIHKNVRTEPTTLSPMENTSANVYHVVKATTVHPKAKQTSLISVHQAISVLKVQAMHSLIRVRWGITVILRQLFPVRTVVFVCLECIVILKAYRIPKIVRP